MPWQVVYYTTVDGKSPVEEFLRTLNKKQRSRVDHLTMLLSEFGPQLTYPTCSHVRGEIRELRASVARDRIRLLYAQVRPGFVILLGFIKRTAKTPPEEIKRAEERLADWKRRMGGS